MAGADPKVAASPLPLLDPPGFAQPLPEHTRKKSRAPNVFLLGLLKAQERGSDEGHG
jgi:hypothetical protein